MRQPGRTFSDRANTSAILQMVVVAMGLTYLVVHFARKGFDLDLNIMIFTFLIFGMLLHRTPIRYVVAMSRACSNISGIVFQYPFYAGIMGIMMATGLGKAMAVWMASKVTLATLPAAAYLLGAFVNFSIPSAGGEWAVIGPPLVEAVRELAGPVGTGEFERHVARVAMAVAYGESLDQPAAAIFPAHRPAGDGGGDPPPGPRPDGLRFRALSGALRHHRDAGGVLSDVMWTGDSGETADHAGGRRRGTKSCVCYRSRTRLIADGVTAQPPFAVHRSSLGRALPTS